jgi:hypothetical protein
MHHVALPPTSLFLHKITTSSSGNQASYLLDEMPPWPSLPPALAAACRATPSSFFRMNRFSIASSSFLSAQQVGARSLRELR